MGVESIFTNAGAAGRGMILDGASEKAILVVINPTAQFKDFAEIGDKLNKLQDKLLKSSKKSLGLEGTIDDVANAATPGSAASDTPLGQIAEEDSNFIKIKVQYNPATLKLYTVNGRIQKRNVDEGVDRLNIYKFSGKSKLSFDLVLDDVDNMNAFMLENMTPNPGNMAAKGMDVYSHGLDHSIRKRMDAMMSLLATEGSRQVMFFWAKMCFRGTLTTVQNRFVMFNPSGNPIRGIMHLEITQDKGFSEKYNFKEKYWDDAYNKAFKDSKSFNKPGVAGQVANNNLVNLSI